MSENLENNNDKKQTSVELLRLSLHSLIQEHSLHEVLDWMRELTFEQAELEKDPLCKDYWEKIGGYLGKATDEALKIANAKQYCDSYWS